MDNFPVNPRPFLVAGLVVNHGWNHPSRAHITLGGELPREHEDFAIVSINPMPQEIGELRSTLNVVCDFLGDTQRVRITESHLSPLGLGLIRLRTVAQRDKLVRESPFNLGQHHVVTVVKHDEGINHRACAYTRVCWIMFLAFPLDYQKDLFIRAVVAPFGQLLEWYRDDNPSRILAQVLTLGPDRVPHSLIVSRGTLIGGMGRSWSMSVYILNGHFPDVFPADEDPVPLDGEPHPEHPPMVFGPNPQPVNWQKQNGVALNLGAFGGGLNQGHPIIHHVNAQPEQDNGDGQDNLNDMQIDAEEPQPLPPQQQINAIQDPRDVMDLDLSGSSMQFLRANGPDIALDDFFRHCRTTIPPPLPLVMPLRWMRTC
jgi:hypothetical protein